MKRLLIVSYYFPPINIVASLRAGKMAKYLPDYGWEPWVLTITPPPAVDQTMEAEVPEERITRTKYLRPRIRKTPQSSLSPYVRRLQDGPSRAEVLYRHVEKLLSLSTVRMPDRALGWHPYAVHAGRHLLRRVKFDAIYSTHGPPTCHLIARHLQRVSGLPWIADYRDLWSENHIVSRGPVWQWFEEQFERWVVRPAAYLITVTKPWGEKLARFTQQPVEVIPHGFDRADMEALPPFEPAPGDPFVLLYPGRLYPHYQDPTPLFQAVRALDRAGHIHPGNFRIHFVGTEPEYPERLARESQISDYVKFSPLVPYTTSLKMQSQATALLMFKWGDPGERGVCPAKLFEYLGVRRPVLTLGDKLDVVDDIVQECGAGASSSSADEVGAILRSWVSTYRRAGELPWQADQGAVRRYTRSAAAAALAHLLDQLTGGWKRP